MIKPEWNNENKGTRTNKDTKLDWDYDCERSQ